MVLGGIEPNFHHPQPLPRLGLTVIMDSLGDHSNLDGQFHYLIVLKELRSAMISSTHPPNITTLSTAFLRKVLFMSAASYSILQVYE